MSDYRRNFVPGGTFFFTLATHKRRHVFTSDAVVDLLRHATASTRRDHPFDVIAAVVLPDHLHAIWTLPSGDDRYDQRWSRIKAEFTRAYLRAGGAEGAVTTAQADEGRRGVWQRRYREHTIESDDELVALVEYIHYNPVKHGYVACPRDWRWSSFHRFVEHGIYPAEWCCGSEPPVRVAEIGARWE